MLQSPGPPIQSFHDNTPPGDLHSMPGKFTFQLSLSLARCVRWLWETRVAEVMLGTAWRSSSVRKQF